MNRDEQVRQIEEAKKAARAEAKRRIAALTDEERHERSLEACLRVGEVGPFRRASVVMLYMPLPRELDVTALALRCFQLGKSVCVPRVEWEQRRMMAVEIHRWDDRGMRTERGVREPIEGAPVAARDIDVVFCPGMAFDLAAHRLGRGGGFYDRFLGQPELRATAVGIGFDVQVMEDLPVLEHDAPLHAVVTDRRLIEAERGRRTPRQSDRSA
jgi:5-formyltetrahydrofolate cyclo-ligase